MTLRLRLSPLLAAGLLALPAQAQPTPADPETAYRAAYQFIARERYEEAFAAMQAFARTHAQSRHADEAGFWSCFSLEHLSARRSEADACYETFAQRYPQSAWRDDAETRRLQLASRRAGGASRQEGFYAASAERLASIYSTAPAAGQVYATTVDRARASTRTHQETSVEILAVQALAQPGNDAAVDDLRRLALESPSAAVRQASIGALARIGTVRSGAALGELVGGLLERAARRDSVAAEAAAEAVAQAARRGDNTLLPFVERYYRNPNIPARLRRMLLSSTQQVGTPQARALQWQALETASLPAMERAELAAWMSYSISPDELTRLGVLLFAERDPVVREGYARALQNIANGAASWGVYHTISNSQPWMSQAGALGETLSPSTVATPPLPPAPAAVAAANADLVATLEREATFAPSSLAEAKASAEERQRRRESLIAKALDLAVTQLRTETSERVQYALVDVLSLAGYDRGVQTLTTLALSTGTHETVRIESLRGLGQIGTQDAFDVLRGALRRIEEPRVLAYGIMALVSNEAFRARAEAVPDLVRLTTHPDLGVRRTAVDALGRLDAPEARQALLDLIRNAGR